MCFAEPHPLLLARACGEGLSPVMLPPPKTQGKNLKHVGGGVACRECLFSSCDASSRVGGTTPAAARPLARPLPFAGPVWSQHRPQARALQATGSGLSHYLVKIESIRRRPGQLHALFSTSGHRQDPAEALSCRWPPRTHSAAAPLCVVRGSTHGRRGNTLCRHSMGSPDCARTVQKWGGWTRSAVVSSLLQRSAAQCSALGPALPALGGGACLRGGTPRDTATCSVRVLRRGCATAATGTFG